MGIIGAWDIIGEGETVALTQLATDCLREKGRPLRIAIDEAGWRFNNLNPYQVKAIKEKEPLANPIEKAIFYRVVGMLKLNIELIFVFDGPARPWKRGSRGGAGFHDKELRLTKCLLKMLGVPYYKAPGEAEAECALLEREGIVDAIWTDDSDAFMFGAKNLIRAHKTEKTAKSKTHVNRFEASKIEQQKKLDRCGFVLLAMLIGGDYDMKGLIGCGQNTALRAVRKGLGKSLCEAAEWKLPHWRQELISFLKGKTEVPLNFPCPKTLKKYMEPNTTSLEDLHRLEALHTGVYENPLDEAKLRNFLREKFNIQTKEYLKHIVPWLLVRILSRTPKGAESLNNIHGVEIKALRGKKNTNDAAAPLERRITFLPKNVTTIDLAKQPEVEDWKNFETKAGGVFDPLARIECEILEWTLQRGVPQVLEVVARKAGEKASTSKAKDGHPSSSSQTVGLTAAKGMPRKRKRDADGGEKFQEDQIDPKPVKKKSSNGPTKKSPSKSSDKLKAQTPAVPVSQPRRLWIPPEIDSSYLEEYDISLLDAPSQSAAIMSLSPISSAEATGTAVSKSVVMAKKRAIVVNLCDDSDDEDGSKQRAQPISKHMFSSLSTKPFSLTNTSTPTTSIKPISSTQPTNSSILSIRNRHPPSPLQHARSIQNSLVCSGFTEVLMQPMQLHSDLGDESSDEPSPEELRRRRLARFAQSVKNSGEEEHKIMQESESRVSTSKNLAPSTGNSVQPSLLQNSRDDIEVIVPCPVFTPRKTIESNLVTSSPLFVTPTVSNTNRMVIDLTID